MNSQDRLDRPVAPPNIWHNMYQTLLSVFPLGIRRIQITWEEIFMKKFILLYKGPATAPEMMTQEQGAVSD